MIIGVLFAYMGYKLFIAGIWGQAGQLETAFGDNKLVLKKAAPGTFFALYGTIIIGITLYKGLEFDASSSSVEGYVEILEEYEDEMPETPPF